MGDRCPTLNRKDHREKRGEKSPLIDAARNQVHQGDGGARRIAGPVEGGETPSGASDTRGATHGDEAEVRKFASSVARVRTDRDRKGVGNR